MSFIGQVTRFLNPGAVRINPHPKPATCVSAADYCQPTIQFDDIAFQFLASESTELVTNGDFVGVTGWTYVGWNKGIIDGNQFAIKNNAVNALSQKGILTINDFYRVTLTVAGYTDGALLVGGGTGSSLAIIVFTVQSNGTFTGYFQYNEAGGAGDFIIQGNSAFAGRVDDVSVIKISDTSDYGIEVINSDTKAVIDTVPAANMQLKENVITVDFNWNDDVTVPNGCIQIQIIDNTNLFEDTFGSNQGWTLGTDVLITGGLMTYTSTGVSRSASIDDIFVIGESYEITYTTSGVTGTGTVQVQCGRTIGTIRSTNGTFVETLTCTDTTQLRFNFTGLNLSTVSIDNVLISKENNIAGRSECYNLQTSVDCTMLFTWSNNQSWGLFDYSANAPGATSTFPTFAHRLRVGAKFKGTKYPSTRIIGENSAGAKSMDYTSLRKIRILDVNRAPDYIHDALAAFFMHDTRTIEGVSYIMEDEYEPSAIDDSLITIKNLMTSRSEIEETDQPNLINRNE